MTNGVLVLYKGCRRHACACPLYTTRFSFKMQSALKTMIRTTVLANEDYILLPNYALTIKDAKGWELLSKVLCCSQERERKSVLSPPYGRCLRIERWGSSRALYSLDSDGLQRTAHNAEDGRGRLGGWRARKPIQCDREKHVFEGEPRFSEIKILKCVRVVYKSVYKCFCQI